VGQIAAKLWRHAGYVENEAEQKKIGWKSGMCNSFSHEI
jgi:hypothetical protein